MTRRATAGLNGGQIWWVRDPKLDVENLVAIIMCGIANKGPGCIIVIIAD
jgi:hypothetical protein